MGAGYDFSQRGSRRKPLGLEPARMPKRSSLKYSKDGCEQLKEAKLKNESWKGKQALKHQQQPGTNANNPATGSNASEPSNQKPRTGFNVGPRLGKGAYHGKFTKIKAGLIHNAKIKKQYAKMLKREGLDGGVNDMDVEEGDQAAASDEGSRMEEDQDSAATSSSTRKLAKGKGRMIDADVVPPVVRKRKSSELDREIVGDVDEEDDDDDEGPAPGFSASTDVKMSTVHPSRSRTPQGPAHKNKKQKVRSIEEDIEEKREKRQADRRAWGKKTKRGQPNLGSRMNVLLGKIEKTVGR